MDERREINLDDHPEVLAVIRAFGALYEAEAADMTPAERAVEDALFEALTRYLTAALTGEK